MLVKIVSIDEEFEKARTKGAIDKQKRKSRLAYTHTGADAILTLKEYRAFQAKKKNPFNKKQIPFGGDTGVDADYEFNRRHTEIEKSRTPGAKDVKKRRRRINMMAWENLYAKKHGKHPVTMAPNFKNYKEYETHVNKYFREYV
jgi:hypothetical protein